MQPISPNNPRNKGKRATQRAFASASLVLADAIAAHDFALREVHCLHFIRRLSFGAGRLTAYIPALRHFAVALRISKGNVSSIIELLKRLHVIEECPQSQYGFLLPIDNWKVPLRCTMVEVVDQLLLLEPLPRLQDPLRQAFVEQTALTLPPAHTSPGPASDQGPAGALPATLGCSRIGNGVPESGTPPPSPERSRIGNTTQVARPPPIKPVPESGTQCSMNIVKNASKALINVHCSTVPESGTPFPNREHLASPLVGLSPLQQDVFDHLAKLGAFGPHNESRGCWFGMVRDRVHVVQRLIGELRDSGLTYQITNPGGYMMDQWKRWGKPNS